MEKEEIVIESRPVEKNRIWKILILILIILLLLAIIIILSLNVYDFINANKNETNFTDTNITDVPSNNGSNINITNSLKTSVCGDKKCNGTENYTNCALDCKRSNPGGGTTPPCTPDCTNKNCGDDSCGESCGPCTNAICNATGRCVPFVNCTADINCTAFTGNCGTGKCNTTTKYCYSSFNSSSTICRNNVSDCDSAELCSGSSLTCGNDLNKTDGNICSSGICTNGKCSTGSCSNDIGCTFQGIFCSGNTPYNCSNNYAESCLERTNLTQCAAGYSCIQSVGCRRSDECLISENCFYVSVSGAGSHNGSIGNEFNLSEAMTTSHNKGGYTFWLSPGNYGNVVFNKGFGNVSGGYNTYMANPLTTVPRDPGWYEGDIDRPLESESVVFSSLFFKERVVNNYAGGHWIELNGINLFDGGISFMYCVANVRVINCSIFGKVPSEPYYYAAGEMTGYGVYAPYYLGIGSAQNDYHDITIDGLYVEKVVTGFQAYFGSSCILKNSHIREVAATMVRVQGGQGFTVDGCHLEYQILPPKANDQSAGITTVNIPDSLEPNRIFTYTDSIMSETASGRAFWVNVTHNGVSKLREIKSYNNTLRKVILTEALPFDVSMGDNLDFYHHEHGSGVAIWGSNLTVRNSKIHNAGATGLFYNYIPAVNSLTIENNLIYDSNNPNMVFYLDTINGTAIIRNNTIVSMDFFYTHTGANKYGKTMYLSPAIGADTASWEIKNNLFVGWAQVVPSVIIESNIVYSGDYEEDETGPNKNNLVYWKGEPYASAPATFDGSENFFLGGGGFEGAFTTRHKRNFNDAFHPMINSDACNGTINAPGVAVGALPCICTNNAQCVEVFGSGSTCNTQSRKCEGTLGSSTFEKTRIQDSKDIGLLDWILNLFS